MRSLLHSQSLGLFIGYKDGLILQVSYLFFIWVHLYLFDLFYRRSSHFSLTHLWCSYSWILYITPSTLYIIVIQHHITSWRMNLVSLKLYLPAWIVSMFCFCVYSFYLSSYVQGFLQIPGGIWECVSGLRWGTK